MKITNIASNMTEVRVNDNIALLVSYSTPVAAHTFYSSTGHHYYKTNRWWSQTTTRHINKWLKLEGFPEVEDKDQKFFDIILEFEGKASIV